MVRDDAQRTTGALLLIRDSLETEPEASRPDLSALYSALGARLMKAGGVDAVIPQNASSQTRPQSASHTAEQDAPVLSRITSGQDLLAQARTLTGYLREQPDGWLAAHRLMKSLRHDTLRAIPAPDAEGKRASNRRGLTSVQCLNGCICNRAGWRYWNKRTALSRVAPIISGWICSGTSIRP